MRLPKQRHLYTRRQQENRLRFRNFFFGARAMIDIWLQRLIDTPKFPAYPFSETATQPLRRNGFPMANRGFLVEVTYS